MPKGSERLAPGRGRPERVCRRGGQRSRTGPDQDRPTQMTPIERQSALSLPPRVIRHTRETQASPRCRSLLTHRIAHQPSDGGTASARIPTNYDTRARPPQASGQRRRQLRYPQQEGRGRYRTPHRAGWGCRSLAHPARSLPAPARRIATREGAPVAAPRCAGRGTRTTRQIHLTKPPGTSGRRTVARTPGGKAEHAETPNDFRTEERTFAPEIEGKDLSASASGCLDLNAAASCTIPLRRHDDFVHPVAEDDARGGLDFFPAHD